MTVLEHVTRLIVEPTADAVILNVRPRMDAGRVALLGHSRGGEGRAEHPRRPFARPAYTLRAVAAFSPTDGPNWSETSPGPGPYDPGLPYIMMMYGTRDGDLSG